jgi:hypothetical protein
MRAEHAGGPGIHALTPAEVSTKPKIMSELAIILVGSKPIATQPLASESMAIRPYLRQSARGV